MVRLGGSSKEMETTRTRSPRRPSLARMPTANSNSAADRGSSGCWDLVASAVVAAVIAALTLSGGVMPAVSSHIQRAVRPKPLVVFSRIKYTTHKNVGERHAILAAVRLVR